MESALFQSQKHWECVYCGQYNAEEQNSCLNCHDGQPKSGIRRESYPTSDEEDSHDDEEEEEDDYDEEKDFDGEISSSGSPLDQLTLYSDQMVPGPQRDAMRKFLRSHPNLSEDDMYKFIASMKYNSAVGDIDGDGQAYGFDDNASAGVGGPPSSGDGDHKIEADTVSSLQPRLPLPKQRLCRDCKRKPVFVSRKDKRQSRVCGACYTYNKSFAEAGTKPCRDCGEKPYKNTSQCSKCYNDDRNQKCEVCMVHKAYYNRTTKRLSHVCRECYERFTQAAVTPPTRGIRNVRTSAPDTGSSLRSDTPTTTTATPLSQPQTASKSKCIDCFKNPRYGSSYVCSPCYDTNRRRGGRKWCQKCGLDAHKRKGSHTWSSLCPRCYDYKHDLQNQPTTPSPSPSAPHKKPDCKYRGFCYLRGRDHLSKFHHPPNCKAGKICFHTRYKHYGAYRHPHMKPFLRQVKRYKLTSFDKIQKFFKRRQSAPANLRITRIDVINTAKHRAKYKGSKKQKMLFHGTKKDNALLIRNAGFKFDFKGNGGMLGKGIYFAPNPQKSLQYCDDKNMMLLSIVNIGEAQQHQNKVFYEYCIPKEEHVMVCFLIRFKAVPAA